MIRMCAWCEAEGRPALIGQKEPLDDQSVTHGICADHAARVFSRYATQIKEAA